MPSADQVPTKQLAFKNALAHVGCPDRRSTGSALRAVRRPNVTSRQLPGMISLSRKRDGFFVSLARGRHGPDHPRDFISERDSRNLSRPPGQQRRKPVPIFGALPPASTP
jgi:hypothetical protein